jgi:enamine deaminase RidA (YjgF/YER057c/UK114 family)
MRSGGKTDHQFDAIDSNYRLYSFKRGERMIRKNVSSGSPYESDIGFSRAVRIGDIISVSGTAPMGPDGSTVFAGDLYSQTKRCLQIIESAVGEAGGSLRDVIRTRIYLIDMSRWEEAARAHGEIFRNIKPTSTIVEVSGFVRDDWLVEIEADCVVHNKRNKSS